MANAFITVTLTSKGLTGAITGLDRLDASLRDMRDLVGQFDTVLAERLALLADATPVQSGEMAGSWDASGAVSAAYEYTGRVFNTSPHAAFVIEGTGVYGPPDKGSGQEIVAQPGRPFVFFKEGRKLTLSSHRGQPANAALNELIQDSSQMLRATGRVLRGAVEAAFGAQATPGIIVHGGG